MIQDNGNRREFETGAVRDVSEGKGRCDLLPLGEVSELVDCKALEYVNMFVRDGNVAWLRNAIIEFCAETRMDIYTTLLEVSKHFEEGCKKYGERNWEKGIPIHCYIDSGVRHCLKYLRGDIDERHDRAFVWNMLCAIWTAENKPECVDLPYNRKVCGIETESEGVA